jgi:hypothetical protein
LRRIIYNKPEQRRLLERKVVVDYLEVLAAHWIIVSRARWPTKQQGWPREPQAVATTASGRDRRSTRRWQQRQVEENVRTTVSQDEHMHREVDVELHPNFVLGGDRRRGDGSTA